MYKYDVHAHTEEVSPCGHIPAKEIARLYRDKGYSGFVITDHYHERYFDSLGDIDWDDKVNMYLEGYRIAKDEGQKLGIDVFLGMELRFTVSKPNDFLVYGFDEQLLFDYPKLYEISLEEFQEIKERYNLLIYQAHPYRGKCAVASPDLLDGVEVYNGHPRQKNRNHLALAFSRQNNMPKISGSDAHIIEDVGRGGILS
ncbi:MAG: transposase, partial [Clostridiales bacterium]|nr:transposase [Clostridiales bacterium]